MRAGLIQELRSIPGVSGTDLCQRARLDFSLFKPGLPADALTEISGAHGSGKTEAALRFLGEHPSARVAWIEEELNAYPRAFPQSGVGLERVLFSDGGADFLWATHQILRSQLFQIVVIVPRRPLEGIALRRLQLLAEQTRASVLLLQEKPTIEAAWPIALQLRAFKKNKQIFLEEE